MERSESFARNFCKEEEIKRIFANNSLQNIGVFAYDTVDSTNTRAKLFAKNCDAGVSPAIFISRAQSAGRGTRARTFESPFGAGLYLSILLPKKMIHGEPMHLTSYTAVIVSSAIERITEGKLAPKIKWVNDLVVCDKKLCGILTEAAFCKCEDAFFIVGIGINLKRGEHSPEVRSLMTSFEDLGIEVDEQALLLATVKSFFSSLDKFDSDEITEKYRSLSSLIGRRVNVSAGNDVITATALTIDNDRAIVIRLDDGSIKKYFSGDVSLRPKGE